MNRYFTILILILLAAFPARSQEHRSEILIDFRVNSTRIDSTYRNNSERLREITSVLQDVLNDTAVSILQFSFCGTSSPEGSYQLNKRLAEKRLEALEKMVRSKVSVSDSLITRDSEYIPWSHLIEMVSASDISHKEEILKILNGPSEIVAYHSGQNIDSRILRLKELAGGKVWQDINRRFFSHLRNASMVLVTFKQLPPPPVVVPEPAIVEEPAVIEEPIIVEEPVFVEEPLIVEKVKELPAPVPAIEAWSRKLYVKSNLLGWGLAVANAAVEMDLGRHWSFNLPVYYSASNYFSSTVKFRTFSVQPEIRYWFSDNNNGWFTGAHVGFSYYNVATGGEFRTQDHGGKSPALGGGVATGYRLPISRDGRWKMEFSLGAGLYRLHHDKFRNHSGGLLVYTEKKNYFGLDQATVSLVYTFDLKKKGGNR